MTESEIPKPNLSGYPTKTSIQFIRHWVEQQHVDVSQFDRIRMCQWMRQLLKYIDKQKEEIENLHDLHDEMRIQDERVEYDTWNDDGGQ
ncbi:MAG: hypothetical protein QQN46_03475 [Nitrosopumilus sp.]